MTLKSSIVVRGALLVSLVLGGYLWHLGDVWNAAHSPDQSQQTPVPIGGTFSLVDQNGMRKTDNDFRGKFMLVFFGYTYCPDVCPTTLAIISSALEKLGPRAQEVVPVFISVDPKRDTPAVLKTYLASFGPQFVGLTGTDKEIDAAAKDYHVFYQVHAGEGGAYAVDHSSVIYLMDKSGGYASNYTLDTKPDDMANDIRAKMDSFGRKATAAKS